MCNFIKFVWLGCEKHSPKMAKKNFRLFFSIFSKTVHTIKTKFSIVILHHIRVLCAMASKSYGWDVRNIAKINPKMAKNSLFSTFLILQKLSIRFERKFLQSFYTILWSFVCKFIKFILLGCEKHSQN